METIILVDIIHLFKIITPRMYNWLGLLPSEAGIGCSYVDMFSDKYYTR